MVRRRKPPQRERGKKQPQISHARIFDAKQVLQLLRQAIELEGSQTAFAKRHAVDRTHLSQILQGKRTISKKFLKVLGLRQVYIAESAKPPSSPRPWTVAVNTAFVVRDYNGQQLAHVCYEEEPDRRTAAKMLTKEEAWRIAVNIAKLPNFLANK